MKIQVTVTRSGVVSNQAYFPSMEEAQAWVDSHVGMGTFGPAASSHLQQFEISPAVLDEEGQEIVPALFEERLVETEGHTVEFTDLTEELEQERVSKEAQEFLSSTDWRVIKHRDQVDMGISPDLSVEEYQYLLTQRQAARAAVVA